MTTDKLSNALVGIIEAVKPDASITVVDARAVDEIDLPTIAVDVAEPERHSLAIPGVMKCPVNVVLRAHSGDGKTRDELKDWADAIEKVLNGPETVRDAITNSGEGLLCHYFQIDGGSTRWEETTFEASFSAEAWVQRTN